MTFNPKTALFLFLTLSVFSSITFPSCLLDDTTPNPIIPHNYSSFESLFQDSAFQIQLRTVDASQNIVFTSAYGTNIKIESNTLFYPNGDQVTGETEIELIELRNKSDLIFSGFPLQKTDGTLLECAGAFSVKATKEEEVLDMDGLLTIRFDDLGLLSGSTEDLSVYHVTNDGSPWEEASAASSVSLMTVAGGDIYELVTPKTGWLSACRPYIFNNNTTSLTLTSNRVGGGIIDQRAYIVFDNIQGMATLPVNSDNNYTTSGLPLGETASVVLMAFDENQFYLDIQNITITENQTIDMSMVTYSAPDFVDALRIID